jgi:glycosyltransferase involved in cell wall biosynthesis
MSKITFIIPVYNEVKTVRAAINEVINFKYKYKEIIIIDNGSNDGSADIIKQFYKFKYIKIILKKKNSGYGSSIKQAINNATGKYIYIYCADLEYEINSCIIMKDYLEKNNLDFILGNRIKKNMDFIELLISLIKKPSYLATIICTFLINLFYHKKFTDIIGSRFCKTSAIKTIKISSNDQGYDFELVSKICKSNLRIDELFVKYTPRANSDEKKIKFYHMFVALFQIFKVKLFN